ncbi:M13 family peptidase [Periweissella cryptocerci]|uniref:M13 family peptidase n=1 Tax=Periweissella cryptocerci TaxID=2506420 RepID=A0A4P6YUX7_9LACO|nr:M13 family metallopeptidase [Periweissella cryptocerci]QBO36523.1 M13 family peptidase [Periweissella cryptocerci]
MMVRIQDDFYTAINQAWLDEVELAPDQVQRGSFSDLTAENERRVQAILTDNNEDHLALQGAKQLYAIALDYERREDDGPFPVQPMAEKILKLRDLAELQEQAAEFIFADVSTPFSFHVAADMRNTNIHVLYADAPRTIMPDTAYYVDDNPEAEHLIESWIEQAFDVLARFGFENTDIGKLIENALVFDKLLSAAIMTTTEADDPWNHYHPTTLADFNTHSQFVDLGGLTAQLVGHQVTKVVIQQQRYWSNFDELVNPQTFPLIKSWMLIKALVNATPYLSESLRQAGGQYNLALTGAKALVEPRRAAFEVVNDIFGEALGMMYAQRHFSSVAHENVTAMITAISAAYQDQLAANDWLSANTKQQARLKLAEMTVRVGAPTQLPRYYAQLTVDVTASYYINVQNLRAIKRQAYFAKADLPVDKAAWHMAAHRVNAYYDGPRNEIVFPAGILQWPFYDVKQDVAANYGGIGTIIAHEMTHALDDKGSHLDATGSLSNWWQTADYQAFKKRTLILEKQFEQQVANGVTVNAQQTLAENVADNGGVTVALAALKNVMGSDANLAPFFASFARIWRKQATPDYWRLRGAVDVHSPAQLRVNITLSNFSEFFTTYDIKAGDAMWRAPQERMHIW